MSLPKVKAVDYPALLVAIDKRMTLLARAASLEYREFQKRLNASHELQDPQALGEHYRRYAHISALMHVEHVRFAISQDAEVAAKMATARAVTYPQSIGFTQALIEKYVDYINIVMGALKQLNYILDTDLVKSEDDPHAYRRRIDEVIDSIRPAEATGEVEPIFSRHHLHANLLRLAEAMLDPVPPLHSFVPATITLSHSQTENLTKWLSKDVQGESGSLNNRFGKNDLNFGELDAHKSPNNRSMGVLVHPVEVYADGNGYVAIINGVELKLTKKEAMAMIVLTDLQCGAG